MQLINSEDGRFSDPSPVVEDDGTPITAEWLNVVQDELVGVVEAAGMALDPSDSRQLAVAVKAITAADAKSAQAAALTATAARDAAIIGAGVYVNEATGRAAVADGAAFKVQGSGDVAAYEYRRTNSTTSVLIATYPSAAAVAAKQAKIVRDTVSVIDFSAYLYIGNIDATTGQISNTNILTRRSIVKYPVNGALTYRIFNNADLLSSLRVAWFDSADTLIRIDTRLPGKMVDWTFTPPAGAATVSITLKSGNTDAVAWDASGVNFYKSTDGQFGITKIGAFGIREDLAADVATNKADIAAAKPDIAAAKAELFPPGASTSTWLLYGVSSGGTINTDATQSHTNLIAASGGDVVTATASIYRINYFNASQAFIGQSTFMGGTSFTIPTGLGVAFIMVSSLTAYGANTTTVSITPGHSQLYMVSGRVSTLEATVGGLPSPAAVTALTNRVTTLEANGVTTVIVGGSAATKAGSSVTLENSTPARSGLMSKEDKAKLDALVGSGGITITGSGVAKNASAYGFLPTNNADQNATALQAAVLGGGLILVDLPGLYDLNKSILLDSRTRLIFGPGVYINKVLYNGKSPRYTFINRGAYTKEYNENITIEGLRIICNGIGNGSDGTSSIAGLRGQVAMHYVKNLKIDDFELLDGEAGSYVIHVCTFSNIKLTNLNIEGWKDAVHLGNGDCFLIRDCRFKTYDDPIALNAHDYSSGQPELGWITNGIIENCYDLADPVRGTTGYFARILAGAWVNWFAGMQVQQSDTIVASNGKMYRVFNSSDGTIYTSNTEPTHDSGTVKLDGINWTMIQENGVTHTVGVRDVVLRNIYLQKPRPTAVSIHFDKDNYSRSYYPNADSPVQSNLVFDGIFQQAAIPNLITSATPLKNVKIINSVLGDTKIILTNIGTTGITYDDTNILMMGNTYTGQGTGPLVTANSGRSAKLRVLGSIKENVAYAPTFSSGVTVLSSDLA